MHTKHDTKGGEIPLTSWGSRVDKHSSTSPNKTGRGVSIRGKNGVSPSKTDKGNLGKTWIKCLLGKSHRQT